MKIKLIAIASMFMVACESGLDTSPKLSEEPVIVQPGSDNILIERRLIKNGSLEFETRDWKKTRQKIRGLCGSLGAYSADESLNKLPGRVLYHQVIRVPVMRFDDFIDAVEKLSGRLENKSIKVDDVTREWVDMEVRVKNKKEMEDRYREMLKQAKTVDEMLKVERYITDVRTDIERMEAGLKSMTDRVAFSSIELTFYENVAVDFAFLSKFTSSLINGWQNLLGILVGLANIWPLLFMTPPVIWLLRKLRRTANRLPASSSGS